MEASMLLGRQINLDKARQLNMMDDHEGMMKEVLKQIGGEAELERMKGFEKRALAKAVGLNVEDMMRSVRELETGVKEAKEKSIAHRAFDVAAETLIVMKDVRDDITNVRSETKKQTTEMTTGG